MASLLKTVEASFGGLPLLTGPRTIGFVGDSSLANQFASLLTDRLKWSATTSARGGNAVADQCADMFLYSPKQNDIYLYSLLGNDKNLGGNIANCEATSKSGHLAGLLHLATKEGSNKVHGQSMVKTGTWGNLNYATDPLGVTSITNGSTLTSTVSGTTVGLVGFWNAQFSGQFSVTIDGVNKGTFACTPPGAFMVSNVGQSHGPFNLTFTGLSAGSHTVVITVTSATGANNGVYIGFVAGYTNGAAINPADPHVICNTTWDWTPLGNTQQGTSTAQNAKYVQMAIDHVTFCRSVGLNVTLVNWNTIIGGNASLILPDQLHPNAAGYELLITATKAALGL